jgi:hypothetical protein
MAITRREEQRLLAPEESAILASTHHPELGALSHEELRSLAFRLREQHRRARDLIREAARARRGKGEARGAAAAAGTLSHKKQVFAAGLRRVNAQFSRLESAQRRAANTAALRAALERRREARPHHPQPGRTASRGMRDTSEARAHPGPDPRAIGSISQATRDNQARRDG